MAKKSKNKISEHGVKTKAGLLLSKFLREIAAEQTELCKGEDGEDRMVTKAEALARLVWRKALGYTETVQYHDAKTGNLGEEKLVHSPDKAMMHLLFDRIEGKTPSLDSGKNNPLTIADRVSQEGKNRINNIITDRKK